MKQDENEFKECVCGKKEREIEKQKKESKYHHSHATLVSVCFVKMKHYKLSNFRTQTKFKTKKGKKKN